MSAKPSILRNFLRSYALVLVLALVLTSSFSSILIRESEIRSESNLLQDRAILLADLITSVSSGGTTMMEMNRQLMGMSTTEGMLFYFLEDGDTLEASRAGDIPVTGVQLSAGGPGGQGGQGGQGGPGGQGVWGVNLQSSAVAAILADLLTPSQIATLSEPSDSPRLVRIPSINPFRFPSLVAGWHMTSGTFLVLRSPDYRETKLDQRLPVLYLGVLGGLLVVAVLSWQLMSRTLKRLLRPFREITEVSEGIVDGRYDRRIPEYPEEELAALGDSVNRMVTRLQLLESLRLSFTAQLAHELRTPLTILRASLQGVVDGVVGPEEIPAFMTASLEETGRLQRLVDDLVDLSVMESSEFPLDVKDTDISALLHSIAAEIRPACQLRGQLLEVSAAPGLLAAVDPSRLRQVLLNLVGNSIRHAGEGRRIEVKAAVHGGMLNVSVRDDGPGIPPERLPSLFERYVKGGETAGSGLGLAISRAIIEAHGGNIQAESDGKTFTELSFRLPI